MQCQGSLTRIGVRGGFPTGESAKGQEVQDIAGVGGT